MEFVKRSALNPAYTLSFEPDRSPHGTFYARTVIERDGDAQVLNIRLIPPEPEFQTLEAAAQAGYDEGERWVERNAGAARG